MVTRVTSACRARSQQAKRYPLTRGTRRSVYRTYPRPISGDKSPSRLRPIRAVMGCSRQLSLNTRRPGATHSLCQRSCENRRDAGPEEWLDAVLCLTLPLRWLNQVSWITTGLPMIRQIRAPGACAGEQGCASWSMLTEPHVLLVPIVQVPHVARNLHHSSSGSRGSRHGWTCARFYLIIRPLARELHDGNPEVIASGPD